MDLGDLGDTGSSARFLIANARPLRTLPQPITDQAAVTHLDIRRRQRLGGILNEYHHAA